VGDPEALFLLAGSDQAAMLFSSNHFLGFSPLQTNNPLTDFCKISAGTENWRCCQLGNATLN